MQKRKTIDESAVKHVANLARLRLSAEELSLYSKQLEAILEYINKLREIDTKDIPPTSHALENLKNVFREDTVKESLPVSSALGNAPQKKDNFFSVPKII